MKKLKPTFYSILLLLSAMAFYNCSGTGVTSETIRFYVGSSNGNLETSIFLCELDPVTGEFAVLDSFAGAKGPSYLAFSPDRKHLYSINQEKQDTASNHMSVSSFRINKETHQLEFLNSQSSEGAGPCHVHCSKKGTFLFTANYSSGNVAAFPISDLGEIQPASSVVQSSGTGFDENRQKGPHTHYVSLDPKENYLLSPDLGTDKVLVYEFDHDSGVLTPNPAQPFFKLAPGAGPRHLVFHPSGEFVYVVNELNSTVTACRYNDQNGTLTKLNVVSTVEEPYEGKRYPAAIRIHPDGNFVYASTRGDVNSIAVFQVDEEGEFYRIQVVEDIPAWPRDFNIDPSGQYLLAAGERSDHIRLYQIDKNSGKLSSTNSTVNLPSPGCILYIE
ncbi:MAG: lactonase family protein [Bacteroidota bacterium]